MTHPAPSCTKLPICPHCLRPMVDITRSIDRLFTIGIPFTRWQIDLVRWKDEPDCQCEGIPFGEGGMQS
jgi:hypothetical protein